MAEPTPHDRPPWQQRVAVACAGDEPELIRRCDALAARLQIPTTTPEDAQHPLMLLCTGQGLELHERDPAAARTLGKPFVLDLTRLATAPGPAGRLSQPLLKAVGLVKGKPRPRVLDATAGLGEDAWLIAAAGCDVLAIERHPLIHALLDDALVRAAQSEPATAARITLMHAVSQPVLEALGGPEPVPGVPAGFAPPEVIYIDPMFAGHRKTAQRKPLRLLRELAGPDADASALLGIALQVASRRVVVKRPVRAEPLLKDHPPQVAHRARGVCYDVYSTRLG